MRTSGIDVEALWLTAQLAGAVALLLLIIGLPIAYWLAFTRTRWRALRIAIESVVALPLVLPPTVLGFYLLTALGAQSPIGRGYEALTGHPLAFSFEGLLVASLCYSLPFAVQPLVAAFRGIDPRLLDAAATLGASPWRRFHAVILPLSWTGVVTGLVLSFAHTVGEFGVVLMVGGNIAGETRTVSLAIYDRVQELDYAAANRTSLLLLVFSFVVLSVVYTLNRRLTVGTGR